MHLGTCYFPEHWPRERWAQDAAMMAEIGIDRLGNAVFTFDYGFGSVTWEKR